MSGNFEFSMNAKAVAPTSAVAANATTMGRVFRVNSGTDFGDR